MFVYCLNTPINFKDSSGCSAVPAFHPTRDRVFRDGGPAGDGASFLVSLLSLLESLDVFTGSEVLSASSQLTTEEENTYAIADTTTKEPEDTVVFPANPYDFNPNNLDMHVYVEPGSGTNGGIIKWEIPNTKIAIFEWNEDYENGPHYHTLKVEWNNKHYGPHHPIGSEVPEPWKSVYFRR